MSYTNKILLAMIGGVAAWPVLAAPVAHLITVDEIAAAAPGQTIRVRSKDRRLAYTAQVIDGTLLKGRL